MTQFESEAAAERERHLNDLALLHPHQSEPLPILPSSSASEPSSSSVVVQLLQVVGDGACLFRSLSQGDHLASGANHPLSKEEEDTGSYDLRLKVVFKMQLSRDNESIKGCLPGLLLNLNCSSFDQYLHQMAQHSTWGGGPEIEVASLLLKRKINVWRVDGRGLELSSTFGEDTWTSAAIDLLWRGGHYDALVEPFCTGGKTQTFHLKNSRTFVDEMMLGQLKGMGYDEDMARLALVKTGNINEAIDWLISH